MKLARVLLAFALVIILAVPLLLKPADTRGIVDGSETLVVVTPHVQQIRLEVGEAFERWMERTHHRRVTIDWRTPGGTTEILKLLEAQFTAAARNGLFSFVDPQNPTTAPGTIGFDVMLGGGSFDHGRLKAGVMVDAAGEKRVIPMSAPAGLQAATLEKLLGENKIGVQQLYDDQQFWIGTALSSFGIVYNEDLLDRAGLPIPSSFKDLTDFRYFGLLSLADPRQSGSITTTFDSILNNAGWEEGWRILRAMAANARSFTSSATKPPIDVSTGEAAAGLVIDFYGRVQAASVRQAGERVGVKAPRVGYVDPIGTVYIDADPVSILRGGPNPELSRLFVEFCLTEEGQALWQFAARESTRGATNPVSTSDETLGPRVHELHRLPIRRIMYESPYRAAFTDDADPFQAASNVASRRWRSAIALMMGAFSIDVLPEQQAAWRALHAIKARNAARDTSTQPSSPMDPLERELDALFFAWPTPEQVQAKYTRIFGAEPPAAALRPMEPGEQNATFKELEKMWRDRVVGPRLKVVYTEIFKDNYSEVVRRAGAAK